MKRIPQLDVLRAIAVLLVAASHLTWSPLLSRFGWTGVDLFFCLSGFLVSGLMFRDYKASGTIRWKSFLIRRGFKIYPAYYSLMLATVIADRFVREPGWNRVTWDRLWADLLFLQDYRTGTWGHLWSLGIEEQFYLLLPLCLCAMAGSRRQDPFRQLPWLCGFVAAACLAMRAACYFGVTPFNHYTHMRPFHLRCDSLMFGVLLSYCSEFRPQVIARLLCGNGRWLLASSLGCLAPALILDQQDARMYIGGLTLLYLGYGGILVYSLSRVASGGPLARIMSGIGRASYSVYLWHLPVAFFSLTVLQARLHWGRNSVFGFYMVASLVVGAGMGRLIEQPALKLRERSFPEAGGSRSTESAAEGAVSCNRDSTVYAVSS